MKLICCDLCHCQSAASDAAGWSKISAALEAETIDLDICPSVECQHKLRQGLDRILQASSGETVESLETIERRHILTVLQALSWNKTQAATVLGIQRSTLDRKLKIYRVGRPVLAEV